MERVRQVDRRSTVSVSQCYALLHTAKGSDPEGLIDFRSPKGWNGSLGKKSVTTQTNSLSPSPKTGVGFIDQFAICESCSN